MSTCSRSHQHMNRFCGTKKTARVLDPSLLARAEETSVGESAVRFGVGNLITEEAKFAEWLVSEEPVEGLLDGLLLIRERTYRRVKSTTSNTKRDYCL